MITHAMLLVVGCAVHQADGSVVGSAVSTVAQQSQRASAYSWLLGSLAQTAVQRPHVIVTIENDGASDARDVQIRVMYSDGSVQYLTASSVPAHGHTSVSAIAKSTASPACGIVPK